MQIRCLHIENFGKLHDFDMDLKEGLNIIRADNGWGKSTLAAFIKAMFYGLDYTAKRSLRENERKKYMPWQGGAFGGSLEFLTGEKAYRMERSFGMKDKEDSFVLYDLDTGLESTDYSNRLGEELFHLDRAAFERSSFFKQQDFSVSLNDSLNAGLTHMEEDAGDMRNYEKAVSSLEERMKYYQKTGNRGQIGKLTEERSKVREELVYCRNKEAELNEWKGKLAEEEQREQELLARIRELEAEEQKVREYREKAAKKEQHDFLRNQAFGKEEQLRQTAAALAEYTGAPAKEAELDQCREQIYRLGTLRMKEEAAFSRAQQEELHLKNLEEEREQVKNPGIGSGILTGGLMAAGVILLIWSRMIPGVILLLSGLTAAFWKIRKEKQLRNRKAVLEREILEIRQKTQKEQKEYRLLQEQRNSVEKQICHFLYIPEGMDFKEMEYRWKLERKTSQEYWMLKQTYESRRKEAQRSRNAYLQFCRKFSKDELAGVMSLEVPGTEPETLKKELENCRADKEASVKEQRDLQNQISLLKEQAERLPELLEDEERISRELADAVREHGILEKTLICLENAREQFSARYLKELKEGLTYYLELLEPEQKMAPSLDVKLNLKVQETGAFRDLAYFSAGWQDLFQIAERLAIIDVLYKEEQPVLILDDPFVNLDTKKRKRAMELLERLAEKRQMIFFTCHG